MGYDFTIGLEDDMHPVDWPIYELSPFELEEARKQIEYVLEHGFIQPSNSPYGAPVLFALTRDGGLHLALTIGGCKGKWIQTNI